MPSDDINRITTFQTQTPVPSLELNQELNQLVSTANTKVGRGVNQTLTGNNVHSGTNTFAGAVTFSSTVSISGSALTLGRLALSAGSELTIASGTITATASHHIIDTEGDASTDDLDTINGAITGGFLILQLANASRVVTVKDGVDNIDLGGSDYTFSGLGDTLTLFYDNANSTWVKIGQSITTSTLDDLTDTDLTSPVMGDRLKYDGTNWVNASKPYKSAAQTITSGGGLTLTHGILDEAGNAVAPNYLAIELVCTDALGDAGYPQNTKLMYLNGGPTNESMGCTLEFNSTTIKPKFGSASSPFYVNHATTGNGTGLDVTKWQAYFHAAYL